MKPQSTLDKWFMRGKDVLLLIGGFGGLGALFVIAVRYYNLPMQVAAQADEIKSIETNVETLHETDLKLTSRMDVIDAKQDYTNKSLDKQSEWLKNISARIK